MKLSNYSLKFFIIILIAALGLTYLGLMLDSLSDKVENLKRVTPPIEVETLSSVNIDYSDGQTIYVPAYSHVPLTKGQAQGLSIFLSVRNTDPKNPITMSRIDYYDTKGELIKQYIDKAIVLAPLETVEYFLEQQDFSGGSGANFFLNWSAKGEVYEPYVEALMYGVYGNASFSFKSRGLVVNTPKE